MPNFNVDVDIDKDEILESLTDQDLLEELNERQVLRKEEVGFLHDDVCCAIQTLVEAADELRLSGKLNDANKLDRIAKELDDYK